MVIMPGQGGVGTLGSWEPSSRYNGDDRTTCAFNGARGQTHGLGGYSGGDGAVQRSLSGS